MSSECTRLTRPEFFLSSDKLRFQVVCTYVHILYILIIQQLFGFMCSSTFAHHSIEILRFVTIWLGS